MNNGFSSQSLKKGKSAFDGRKRLYCISRSAQNTAPKIELIELVDGRVNHSGMAL